jgi:phage tail protein X
MEQITGYTTALGDRLDTLAHAFYGGNFGIAIIADANPDVPVCGEYPLGTELAIPIIDGDAQLDWDLPPWKLTN